LQLQINGTLGKEYGFFTPMYPDAFQIMIRKLQMAGHQDPELFCNHPEESRNPHVRPFVDLWLKPL